MTEAGDLFRADGSAVSGSEGRQKLLSRTREIRELGAEKQLASEQAAALAEKIREIAPETTVFVPEYKEVYVD